MNNSAFWITPLALLPGVALLILSTSTRFGQLHQEIHHIFEKETDDSDAIMDLLLKRAILFKKSLFYLYSSVVLFAIASLLGGLNEFYDNAFYWIVFILLFLGVAAVIIASVFLLIESTQSQKIIEFHWKERKR